MISSAYLISPEISVTAEFSNNTCDLNLRLPHGVNRIGELTGFPIIDIDYNGKNEVATAGVSNLATYDIIKQQRLFRWSTGASDSANTCKYMTPNLVAVAGDGCTVTVVDTRGRKPVFSKKIAKDNLYHLTWNQEHGFCVAGADGAIYQLDMRNEKAITHTLEEKLAIVGMAQHKDKVLVVLENGAVRLLLLVQLNLYLWKLDFEHPLIRTKVGCDFQLNGLLIDVAYGDASGNLYKSSGGYGVAKKRATAHIGTSPVSFAEYYDDELWAASDTLATLSFEN